MSRSPIPKVTKVKFEKETCINYLLFSSSKYLKSQYKFRYNFQYNCRYNFFPSELGP